MAGTQGGAPNRILKGVWAALSSMELDTGLSEDIGDFVGVGDGGDGAVGRGEAGELGGDEHGRFDVDVGVDEAGEEVGEGFVFGAGDFDAGDFSGSDLDGTGADEAGVEVHDVSAEVVDVGNRLGHFNFFLSTSQTPSA